MRSQWNDLQYKGFEGVNGFIRAYKAKKPEAPVFDEIVRDAVADTIGSVCLQNFAYGGNADGYVVPGGKIAAKKLAFCVFDNPGDAYALEQKIIAKAEKCWKINTNASAMKMYTEPLCCAGWNRQRILKHFAKAAWS